MRTIKFLGFAVAFATASTVVSAQTHVPPGAFPSVDRMARYEARQIERAHMRRFADARAGHMQAHGRMGRWSARPRGWQGQAAPRAARAGFRAGLRAIATPEQKVFAQEFAAQRQTVHAQVLEGKLTREQARTQLRQWAVEHRPK